MYKKVLTTNPLKREEKDFFYVDLLRGSKNRRTLPNINTLKREESNTHARIRYAAYEY